MDPFAPLAQLIGDTPALAAVRDKLRRLLQHPSEGRRLPPVLIQGETGTGKGLLARGIHAAGPRASGPFVDVNCAAIPETLLEAEMFGFERGAFTDARQAKPGLFQVADRGTLFLDEIGLVPEALQAKLLKAIEERAVRRLGSTRTEPVDPWIIAATSEDLGAALRARRFREDLYHRLAVVTVALPPLRARGGDIVRLAEHFLARACADYGLAPRTLAPDARTALAAYPWPGNVRELANVMERVALLAEAPVITAGLLGLPATSPAPTADASAPRRAGRPAGSLHDAVGGVEREHLLAALRATDWNVSHAAARLGISRNTLRYRIEKHGLRPEPSPPRRAPTIRRTAAAPAPAPPPAVAAAPAAMAAVVRWEQRYVTVLRAVLAPPPDAAGAGAGRADSVTEGSRALAVLVEKVQSFGGRLAALSAMGLVAEFGVQPTDDAPGLAAHAAMAMKMAAERAQQGDPGRPRVRIAIHTALATVGRIGEVVEVDGDAARDAGAVLEALIAQAEPNTVVVSEGAATFLARHFHFRPVPGPPDSPVRAHRLAGRERPGFGPGGRVTKFVGRRRELELLQHRFAAALGGRGQAVSVVGEPGIGKSRLVYEFRRMLSRQGQPVLRARCAAHTQATALVPLVDLVKQICRIREGDTPEAARQKLERVRLDLGLSAAHQAALAEVLGLATQPGPGVEPEERRRQAFEALAALGLSGTAGRPTVLVVEDLHWVDRSTEEFLVGFLPRIETSPVLFLFTARPEYTAPWSGQPFAAEIPVRELTDAEAAELLDLLLPPGVPGESRRTILERARGNPFYLEEQARAAVEPGAPAPPAGVPDTIQGLLTARIDRLADEPRRLLRTASVLGRDVPVRLLQAIWPGGDLAVPLHELVRQGFLHERMSGEEGDYLFKHALTQEVAYGSLPAADRPRLHAAAGRALETLYADRLHEVYDRLAYHYARTEQAEKAVLYLTRFAKQAARISAHAEAVGALGEAVAHVERLPATAERDRRLLDLVLRQARSLFFLGRAQESLNALLRQEARLEGLADPALAGRYHFLLARNWSLVGDRARAVDVARRAIDEARAGGDDATVGKALYVLAREAYWAGQPRQALDAAREAAALLAHTGERVWLGQTQWVLGVSLAFRGEFGPALEVLATVDALGRALGDPRLESYAASTIGSIRALLGEPAAGLDACRRGVARAPDPLSRAVAVGHLGYALVETGDPAAALPLLDESLRQLREFRFRQLEGSVATWLAEACLGVGDPDGAAPLVDAALAIAGGGGYGAGLGFALRARARLDRAHHALGAAAAGLDAAIDAFTRSEARFEAARTRLARAELAAAGGDRDAAARQLGAAVEAFRALGAERHAEGARQLAARLALALA